MDNSNLSIIESIQKSKVNFSNKQEKLLKKLTPIIGKIPSIALINLKGGSSFAEINVIAELMSTFSPINIFSYREQPAKVIFESIDYNNIIIRFHPQYYIEKPDFLKSKQHNYYAIDLAIELHMPYNDTHIKIFTIGLEYDGHPDHYLESGIKKSYIRDLGIMNKESFHPLRISPEGWNKHKQDYISTIRACIDREIHKFHLISSEKILTSLSLTHTDNPEFEIININGVNRAIPLEKLHIYNKTQ